LKTELTETKASCASLRAELSELKKDRDSSARAVRSAEHSVTAFDTKIQHLTDEVRLLFWCCAVPSLHLRQVNLASQLDRHKAVLKQEREGKEEIVRTVRKLERQKMDLLAAFKKQMRLINVLKRQKIHV
jgi:chromosome segregation ATPase